MEALIHAAYMLLIIPQLPAQWRSPLISKADPAQGLSILGSIDPRVRTILAPCDLGFIYQNCETRRLIQIQDGRRKIQAFAMQRYQHAQSSLAKIKGKENMLEAS
jgi:hypothetical protein